MGLEPRIQCGEAAGRKDADGHLLLMALKSVLYDFTAKIMGFYYIYVSIISPQYTFSFITVQAGSESRAPKICAEPQKCEFDFSTIPSCFQQLI